MGVSVTGSAVSITVSVVRITVVGIGFSFGFGISGPLSSVVSTVSVSTISVSTVSVVSTVGLRLGLSKSTCQSGEKGYGKLKLKIRIISFKCDYDFSN